MSNQCDLHIHSLFSDSDATIEHIFTLAKAKNLRCIALTDHDTTAGVEEARHFSKQYNIELIDSIELSAQRGDVEVHILGYFLDPFHSKLKKALSDVRELRRERLLHMADKLTQIGIPVDTEEVFRTMKGAIATRLHLGVYLLKKGYVSSLGEAFKKYLAPGKPGYVSRFKFSVEEAIALLKECGGLTFLAHPHLLYNDSWIEEFVSSGLDGMEVVYPYLKSSTISAFMARAQKLGLLRSGGSDAHGSYKRFTTIGEVSIPYEWIMEMKERLRQTPSPTFYSR